MRDLKESEKALAEAAMRERATAEPQELPEYPQNRRERRALASVSRRLLAKIDAKIAKLEGSGE